MTKGRGMSSQAATAWLRNAWYAAAWSSEFGAELCGRTLLDQPVVFYRKEDGNVAAIGGRCPHRFAPLALGRLTGDCIECPYHGLRFDANGACVHNPHGDGHIPGGARVPAFRVAERWGMVWLWGGDSAQADESAIPDLQFLERSDLGHVRGHLQVEANYELYIDNLMDLTHAQFVHGDRLATSNFANAKLEVLEDGDTVKVMILIANSDVPVAYRKYVPENVKVVDLFFDSSWQAPSVVTNFNGVTLPGRPKAEGNFSFGTHIVTPASRGQSHYFFCNSRNTSITDPSIDDKVREWQRVGFGEQDKRIVEAVARMMQGEVDPIALKAVLLRTDAGAVRARRTLKRLIQAEIQATIPHR
jgi:phenylpropionate dioxygenase-like ring-hydroxylating dioxygenase large terminal subunit